MNNAALNRLLGLALLGGGVALIVLGINASQSFASDVSRFFSGSPTNKSVWFLVGGIVCSVLGLFMAFGAARNRYGCLLEFPCLGQAAHPTGSAVTETGSRFHCSGRSRAFPERAAPAFADHSASRRWTPSIGARVFPVRRFWCPARGWRRDSAGSAG